MDAQEREELAKEAHLPRVTLQGAWLLAVVTSPTEEVESKSGE